MKHTEPLGDSPSPAPLINQIDPTPPFTKQLTQILEKAGVKDWGMGWDDDTKQPVEINPIEEAITAIEAAVLTLIGEDEPDTTKDAYSTSALVKDARNQLRVQLREGLRHSGLADAEETKSE